jgi:hypothetical protein
MKTKNKRKWSLIQQTFLLFSHPGLIENTLIAICCTFCGYFELGYNFRNKIWVWEII